MNFIKITELSPFNDFFPPKLKIKTEFLKSISDFKNSCDAENKCFRILILDWLRGKKKIKHFSFWNPPPNRKFKKNIT